MPVPIIDPLPTIQKVEQRGNLLVTYRDGAPVEARRDFYVEPYLAFPTFVQQALGNGLAWAPNAGHTIIPPREHPVLDGMFAVDADIKMSGQQPLAQRLPPFPQGAGFLFSMNQALDTPENVPSGAIVTIIYRPILDVDVSYQYGGQMLTNANANWFINDLSDVQRSAANANVNISRFIPQIDYMIRRRVCRKPPRDAINKLLGRINYNPWTVEISPVLQGRITAPLEVDTWSAETVLFDRVVSERRISVDGRNMWECVYGFAIFPLWDKIRQGSGLVDGYVGWNRKYWPGDGSSGGGYWEYPVQSGVEPPAGPAAPWTDTRYLFRYAEAINQTIGGNVINGFDLLFTDGAT